MAEALLISRKDIVRYTSLNGSVDVDKYIQFIYLAQNIHLENYCGTDLLNKIKADIIGGTLTGNYETLVKTYLKPMLIHWAMVEYLPFASVVIGNTGLFRHNSENATNLTQDEIEKLVKKEQKIAQYYTERFINYMNYNQTLFPEYSTNTNDDTYPDTDIRDLTNWYI